MAADARDSVITGIDATATTLITVVLGHWEPVRGIEFKRNWLRLTSTIAVLLSGFTSQANAAQAVIAESESFLYLEYFTSASFSFAAIVKELGAIEFRTVVSCFQANQVA